jgi:hypothetical protein
VTWLRDGLRRRSGESDEVSPGDWPGLDFDGDATFWACTFWPLRPIRRQPWCTQPPTPVAGLPIGEPAAKLPATKWTLFGLTVLLSLGMSPSLAETVLLRCVTSVEPPKAKEIMMVVVDWAHGEIKTENFSTDKPPKWMIFRLKR